MFQTTLTATSDSVSLRVLEVLQRVRLVYDGLDASVMGLFGADSPLAPVVTHAHRPHPNRMKGCSAGALKSPHSDQSRPSWQITTTTPTTTTTTSITKPQHPAPPSRLNLHDFTTTGLPCSTPCTTIHLHQPTTSRPLSEICGQGATTVPRLQPVFSVKAGVNPSK